MANYRYLYCRVPLCNVQEINVAFVFSYLCPDCHSYGSHYPNNNYPSYLVPTYCFSVCGVLTFCDEVVWEVVAVVTYI